MSGKAVLGSFGPADYVVFAVMLVVSAAVGVYYAWADRGPSSSGDFLTGGRRLTALPVSLSLTASFMSAITVLSNPAEVRILQMHTKKRVAINRYTFLYLIYTAQYNYS